MDKTEEYVLMCREAEEIQVLCKYEAYDYFANPKNFRDIVRCGDRILESNA